MVRILGVDPGLRQTGWAIIEAEGQKWRQIAVGTLRTDVAFALGERLMQLFSGLEDIIETHQPDEAAVEETFVNSDPRGALKLGQARAMAMLVPARAGIKTAEYAPNTIKKTVVGAGHADKAQVEYMIKLQIKGASPDSPDAADALAIALCHAHRRKMRSLVA